MNGVEKQKSDEMMGPSNVLADDLLLVGNVAKKPTASQACRCEIGIQVFKGQISKFTFCFLIGR